jgi:hypothetical protein
MNTVIHYTMLIVVFALMAAAALGFWTLVFHLPRFLIFRAMSESEISDSEIDDVMNNLP